MDTSIASSRLNETLNMDISGDRISSRPCAPLFSAVYAKPCCRGHGGCQLSFHACWKKFFQVLSKDR